MEGGILPSATDVDSIGAMHVEEGCRDDWRAGTGDGADVGGLAGTQERVVSTADDGRTMRVPMNEDDITKWVLIVVMALLSAGIIYFMVSLLTFPVR